MKNILILFLSFLMSLAIGQNKHLDNQHEVGVSAGANNYTGDIGAESFLKPNDWGLMAFYKFKFNKRFAARVNVGYNRIKAFDSKATSAFRQQRNSSFGNVIYDAWLGAEFNFFDFDPESDKDFTPYVFVGFGVHNSKSVGSVLVNHVLNTDAFGAPILPTDATDFNTLVTIDNQRKTQLQLPFGVGVKKKISYRFTLGLEWRANMAFHDNIDFSSFEANNLESTRTSLPALIYTPEIERREQNIINSLTFGDQNTNDWYFYTGLHLSYSFGRGFCYCNDDNKKKRRKKKLIVF